MLIKFNDQQIKITSGSSSRNRNRRSVWSSNFVPNIIQTTQGSV